MNNIKQIRHIHGLTQQDMADLLNISRLSFCRYENGSITPPLDVLIKIADHFDLSLDYITGRSTESSNTAAPAKQTTINNLPQSIDDLSTLIRKIVRQELEVRQSYLDGAQMYPAQ